MRKILVLIAVGVLLAVGPYLGLPKGSLEVVSMIVGALALPVILLLLVIFKLKAIAIDRTLARLEEEAKQRDDERKALQDSVHRAAAQGDLVVKTRQAIVDGDVKFVAEAGRTLGKALWAFVPKDANGNAPDHIAAMKGDEAMIETLAAMGLAVIDRNRAGKTMLDVAAKGRTEAIKAAYCRGYGRCLLRGTWGLKNVSPDDHSLVEQLIAELLERRHGDASRPFSVRVTAEEGARRFVDLSLAASSADDFDRALKIADLAVRVAPQMASTYNRRAAARWGKRDHPGALADINEAVRLAPADAQQYETRAAMYEKMDQVDNAMGDYMTAIELDPSRTHAQERLNVLTAAS
jgi:tetratricopeptide (TPR) repeat protein